MIFRYIRQGKLCIYTGEAKHDNREREFSMTVEELAVNNKLLNAFGFMSIKGGRTVGVAPTFSTPPPSREEAVRFFTSYLGAFTNKQPELKSTDTLHIIVECSELRKRVEEILKTS